MADTCRVLVRVYDSGFNTLSGVMLTFEFGVTKTFLGYTDSNGEMTFYPDVDVIFNLIATKSGYIETREEQISTYGCITEAGDYVYVSMHMEEEAPADVLVKFHVMDSSTLAGLDGVDVYWKDPSKSSPVWLGKTGATGWLSYYFPSEYGYEYIDMVFKLSGYADKEISVRAVDGNSHSVWMKAPEVKFEVDYSSINVVLR